MKRDFLLFLVALAALMGSVTAALGTAAQRDRDLQGYVNPAQTDALPFSQPRLGVNIDFASLPAAQWSQTLDQIAAAGIYWLRQPIRYSLPSDPLSDYAKFEPLFTQLRTRHDLALIAVLRPAPAEADPQMHAEAARAFALAYGDVIDHYQIDDEPNLSEAWGAPPEPAAYAARLSAIYSAIHSADPDAEVIAAALAPTLETGPDNLNDLRYLEQLYQLGLADFSDGIAIKPYGFDSPPDAEADPTALNFRRALLLRDVMLRYDDAQTPLWASEWGWNHLPDDWQGSPSIWGQVSADQRSAYTLTALDMAADFPWLTGLILQSWQPADPPDDPRWGFALIDPSGAPTPLYTALAARSTPPTAAPIGLFPAANPYTRYSGVWTFSDLGADIGWVGDSQFSFTFAGDAVSLLLREGDYAAYLYVTVNGQPANALPRDAADQSYIILTSDTLNTETRLIPVARGLGPGIHTLQVRTERGWDRWALVGMAVGGPDRAAPYQQQIVIAWVTAAAAASSVFFFGSRIRWSGLIAPLRPFAQRIGEVGGLLLGALASLLLMVGMLLTWRDATPELLRREPIQLGLALVSAGLLYLNPALVLSIVAAAALFVLFYHRPLHGLTLTLLSAPFFLFPVELYRFAFPLSELLLLISAAAWGLRSAVGWARDRRLPPASTSQPPIRLQTLDLLFAAYLALGVLSLIWTAYRDLAFTELRTLFLEPALFYLVLRASRPTRADLLRLVDALLISGLLVAVIGLFLYVRGDAIITAEAGARRLASVYGSPNNVALWLGRCLPFALAYLLAPLDRRRRLFGAASVLIFLPALALTLSAGALFLGVPAAVAAVLLSLYGRRAALPLVGLAGLGALTLPLLAQIPRFARLLDPTEGTNFFRLRTWQSAIAMLRDHPLTGIGQDQFLNLFRGRYILPDAWQEPNLSHPHNLILDAWLRLGLVGLALMAAFLGLIGWRLAGAVRGLRTTDAYGWALAIGGLGCLANLVAHGLIDNSIWVNDLVLVLALLAGLAVQIQGRED